MSVKCVFFTLDSCPPPQGPVHPSSILQGHEGDTHVGERAVWLIDVGLSCRKQPRFLSGIIEVCLLH